MANLNVAVIGPNDFAKDLGKKGTASDITLYDLKQGTDTVTFIEPTKYPDRLAPLFYAVSMADRALVVVEAVNAQLGECIVMLQCAGVSSGYIVLRNYLTPEQLAPLIKGTVLESYRYVEEDKTMLREMLLDEARGRPSSSDQGRGAVPIDHFFNVKGVGTVVLGYVARGRIEKHDELKVLPTERTALVRSIQKHDDDFEDAVHGDRVGLALKSIDVEQLDRGYVLSADPGMKCDGHGDRGSGVGQLLEDAAEGRHGAAPGPLDAVHRGPGGGGEGLRGLPAADPHPGVGQASGASPGLEGGADVPGRREAEGGRLPGPGVSDSTISHRADTPGLI